jgi:hypothetical protein
MNLTERIRWASELGKYILSDDPDWVRAKEIAFQLNPWFTSAFIDTAVTHIGREYLDPQKLTDWANTAGIPNLHPHPQQVGLVMAGNIPLVGFHDWLSVLISGHHARIKLSSQDTHLFSHLQARMLSWTPDLAPYLQIEERLTGADAFIATGSDNTARYFEYYFGKYPHIIRKNRTSVAVLDGREEMAELNRFSEDIYLYFGRGCRNVTHLLVPEGYDFIPLLNAAQAFQPLAEHHKFKNNYDYQLALKILNKEFYMTNGILLFSEHPSLFAPIGVIHYSYYSDPLEAAQWVESKKELIQCQVGVGGYRFGTAQHPGLNEYADGVDTLAFLRDLQPTR